VENQIANEQLETTENNLIDPLGDDYERFKQTIEYTPYEVPQTLLRETTQESVVPGYNGPRRTSRTVTEEYIPSILEDANHVIMKLKPSTGSKRYLCFLASSDDGGEGVLGGEEYKKLLESTVQSEDVEVCSP